VQLIEFLYLNFLEYLSKKKAIFGWTHE